MPLWGTALYGHSNLAICGGPCWGQRRGFFGTRDLSDKPSPVTCKARSGGLWLKVPEGCRRVLISVWISGSSVFNFITFCGEWHLAVVMTKYMCHPLQHLRGRVWPHQHADSWMLLGVRVAGWNGASFYTVWCWCWWLAIKFNWKLLAHSEVKY